MTLETAIATAATGKRVLWVTGTQRTLTSAVNAAVKLAGDAEVTRANGHDKISYPNGGELRFRTTQQSLRGETTDAAWVTTDLTYTALVDLTWALHASTLPDSERCHITGGGA